MKISVVMPSLLSEFPGCAPNRKQTFMRAVNSFLAQQHKQKELIIASDGCGATIEIVKRNWKHELKIGIITLVELPPHELFTGAVRQAAIDKASGDVICNLDTDDVFEPHHLLSIALNFGSADWVYFNYWIEPYNLKAVRGLYNCDGTINTLNNGTIAWRHSLGVSWNECDGKFDNKKFCKKLLYFPNRKKIYGTGYICTNGQI